jgi:transposase-like protein
MHEGIASTVRLPGSPDSLNEILRRGAQQMLAQAIEAEVAEWIDEHQHVKDERGRRQVVRNGYLPERKLVTPVGELAVKQLRGTIGDGALGFWKAIAEVFPSTKEQRCWVHKTANVLDILPKNKQAKAKNMIHEIWMAETKADAVKALMPSWKTIKQNIPRRPNA